MFSIPLSVQAPPSLVSPSICILSPCHKPYDSQNATARFLLFSLTSVPHSIPLHMILHVASNHSCEDFVTHSSRLLVCRPFHCLDPSDFSSSTITLWVIHSGIVSGSSIHLVILLASAFQTPLNFLHQKFCIRSILGADQFFLFLNVSYNFFSVIYSSSTLVTFAFIFSAIVFLHFL